MNMTDTILVDGLRFAYPPIDDNTPAPLILENLNLCVRAGEWLAVMGPSDAGKTTLCLLLAGLAPHLTGGTIEGQIIVAGQNTEDCPPPTLAVVVGILFQEPDAQLFNSTVEAEVAWGLENLGLPVPQIQARVDEMLALLHLDLAAHPLGILHRALDLGVDAGVDGGVLHQGEREVLLCRVDVGQDPAEGHRGVGRSRLEVPASSLEIPG